jgi:hypothetical protein
VPTADKTLTRTVEAVVGADTEDVPSSIVEDLYVGGDGRGGKEVRATKHGQTLLRD